MSGLDIVRKGAKVARNMGWRYIAFRSVYELNRKTGRLRKRFPQRPELKEYITLQQWKEQSTHFFFTDKTTAGVPHNPDPALAARFEQLKAGRFSFFNGPVFDLGQEDNWMKNPDTGFVYDQNKHWTDINDYSAEAGDIKFVWEKARFAHLYDIIRYDYHFGEDCSAYVFNSILSWIRANPVNSGPHYKCSQEISLRVLNWTFALHYYKQSPHLTDKVFRDIQYAIYWQLHHVYENIDFSRIAVRNNHAITETLALYLGGLLYPGFPGANKWKINGKKWFEEEIRYQVYEDGTFLQFSMNYHRVVIQLLTWGLQLAALNNESFDTVVADRARKSLLFLRACMHDENGWLPNYGANDGALFFKLNNEQYRDYRPQLQALAAILEMDPDIPGDFEDVHWYGKTHAAAHKPVLEKDRQLYSFPKGGYYVCREADTVTFMRCGSHRDRPSQADNLHLDVWYRGENILMDGGSYKYNTDEQTLRYFMGSASHNNVMLDQFDQMEKGPRFIWYNWTQCLDAKLYETDTEFVWEGQISGFEHVGKGITHRREVRKRKGMPRWTITDTITHKPAGVRMRQLWHTGKEQGLSWQVKDGNGTTLTPEKSVGFYSSLYGMKEENQELVFSTDTNIIITEINLYK
jgi:hypothetical protein